MHHVAIVPEWYRGTLDASGDPSKQFWFTVISPTLEDGKERTITLVAGSLGDAAGFSVNLPARDGETDRAPASACSNIRMMARLGASQSF